MKRPKITLSGTLKQEFKKDLELFENFLVILNNSSPIRNVEMMWADDLDLLDPHIGRNSPPLRRWSKSRRQERRTTRDELHWPRARIFAIWSTGSVRMKSRPVPRATSRRSADAAKPG